MKKIIAAVLKDRFGRKPAPQPGWLGTALRTLNNQPKQPPNNMPKGQLPRPRPMEERLRCKELYEHGLSYREIAEQTNVPRRTICVWKNREKWEVSKPDALAITTTESDEEIPATLHERQELYSERMQVAAVKLSNHVSKLDGEALVKHSDKILKADKTSRVALKLESDKPRVLIDIGILAGERGPVIKEAHANAALTEPETFDVKAEPVPDTPAGRLERAIQNAP